MAAGGVKCPNAVQVGPWRYVIRPDPGVVDREHYGVTRHGQQTIAFDPNLAPDQRAVTLLHEVLHVIWRAAGDRDGKVTEEEAVETIAATLLDTMRRNPQFVAWLLAPAEHGG